MSLSDAVDVINAKNWDDEKKQRYIASLTAYADYGDVGLDAWDYCRAIQILQDSYVSGQRQIHRKKGQIVIIDIRHMKN